MTRRWSVLALAGAILLSACGSGAKAASQPASQPATPSHIVSLSATATEMLFAIGAGPQVKAVDDQSNYPPTAPRTKLSGYQPNVEAIAGYSPDLVVLSDGAVAPQLRALHIKVMVAPPAKTLTDSYDQITELGKTTGHTREAAQVVSGMKHDIADIAARVPRDAKELTYYHEVDNTYFTASSRTFIGQIYAIARLHDIADAADKQGSGGYPQLSAEYIVQQNPDLIFLADGKCCGQSPQTIAARPGWGGLRAVTAHHVIVLDDDIASRWGPRVVDLLRTVVQAADDARKG